MSECSCPACSDRRARESSARHRGEICTALEDPDFAALVASACDVLEHHRMTTRPRASSDRVSALIALSDAWAYCYGCGGVTPRTCGARAHLCVVCKRDDAIVTQLVGQLAERAD